VADELQNFPSYKRSNRTREQCYLLTSTWQMPCENLVSALRSKCSCVEGCLDKCISRPWQARFKSLANHLQIFPIDEWSSEGVRCTSIATWTQAHGICFAKTWLLSCEAIADALQDVMALPFPYFGKLVAKALQFTCRFSCKMS
jgi:hypothetical protein